MINKFFRLFLLWVGLCAPLAACASNVSLDASSDWETITIQIEELSPYKVFILTNPDRLVVDVPFSPDLATTSVLEGEKSKRIRKMRYGRFDAKTSRLVFELQQPVRIEEVLPQKNKGRLVIRIASQEGEGEAKKKQSFGSDKQPKKQAAQKKPSKPVIVIDPGHGGEDPGTSGPEGTREKAVVLEYAKALKAKLQKTGRYQAILTRESDTYVPLRERVEFARRRHASLFISLHADSASSKAARGLSIYTLSEKASDSEAAALAARENKSDIVAGIDMAGASPDVVDILISLAERDTKNRSATLADILVTSLDDKVLLLPNSHRFAGFAVLKAPDVPSVLVEIGFLSHPHEEQLIRSKSYKEKVTGGIVLGIEKYFELEKELRGE